MVERVVPILVEQAPRKLPGHDTVRTFHGEIPVCWEGVLFVDELYRERRISSVEWRLLSDAIWPRDPRTGEPLLQVTGQPNPSSARQDG